MGWWVFRLSAGTKLPVKGSHGFKDATVDTEVITRWWTETPNANIGLATGYHPPDWELGIPGINIAVIDCDGEGGLEEFKAVCKQWCGTTIPRTLTARTSNGWHFYYNIPLGTRLRSNNAKRAHKGAPGIDLKADNGYVVLPPSVNAKTGFVYEWVNWGYPLAVLS
jgi:hypothetical protein